VERTKAGQRRVVSVHLPPIDEALIASLLTQVMVSFILKTLWFSRLCHLMWVEPHNPIFCSRADESSLRARRGTSFALVSKLRLRKFEVTTPAKGGHVWTVIELSAFISDVSSPLNSMHFGRPLRVR
jgi:hypothetical protein